MVAYSEEKKTYMYSKGRKQIFKLWTQVI